MYVGLVISEENFLLIFFFFDLGLIRINCVKCAFYMSNLLDCATVLGV